MLALLRMVT